MLNWINNRINSENVKRSHQIKECKQVGDLTSKGAEGMKYGLFYFGETYENLYKNIHMQIPDHAGQLNLFHITDDDCAK